CSSYERCHRRADRPKPQGSHPRTDRRRRRARYSANWVRRHGRRRDHERDRKSTRLNSSHGSISYAVFCLKKKTPNRLAGLLNSEPTNTATAHPGTPVHGHIFSQPNRTGPPYVHVLRGCFAHIFAQRTWVP